MSAPAAPSDGHSGVAAPVAAAAAPVAPVSSDAAAAASPAVAAAASSAANPSAAASAAAAGAAPPAAAASPAPSPSASSSSSSSSSSFRPNYLNILGATVLDDNVRLLSDFLYQYAQQADVEIEGKLGLVFNKKKERRVYIDGVKSIVYLATDELDAGFSAEVDANMFRHLNEDLIQRRYLEDQSKARAAHAKPYWRYSHIHQTDKFHTVGNDRVRVSYDAAGQVVECIVKDKLQHVDFWNGKAKCIDFRISANRERRVEMPRTECDQIRRKDRMSYRFDMWAIELTKVEMFTSVKNGEPASERPASTTFEVEVEIKELDHLRREAAKVKAGQPNEFVRIASAFFDTLRTLSQYAFPGQIPANWKPLPPAAAPAAAPPPTKKRPREDEQAAAASKEEYGRAWS